MGLRSVRPKFSLVLAGDPDDAAARLSTAAREADVRVTGRHASVGVGVSVRKRWSPVIQIEFEPDERGTLARGVVGPRPAVWTFYAFLASNVAIAGAFAVVVGLTQLMLDSPAWGFLGIPMTAALLGGLYGVSQAGRSLAEQQTDALRTLLRETLEPIEERDGPG